jgi:hypothetical protein
VLEGNRAAIYLRSWSRMSWELHIPCKLGSCSDTLLPCHMVRPSTVVQVACHPEADRHGLCRPQPEQTPEGEGPGVYLILTVVTSSAHGCSACTIMGSASCHPLISSQCGQETEARIPAHGLRPLCLCRWETRHRMGQC